MNYDKLAQAAYKFLEEYEQLAGGDKAAEPRSAQLYSQAEAGYVNHAHTEAACASCRWFMGGGGRCHLVEGIISPQGTCRLYQARQSDFAAYKQTGLSARGGTPEHLRLATKSVFSMSPLVSNPDDLAVKNLGKGLVGGYGLVFGSPQAPDLEGDFFTPDTNFWEELPTHYKLFDHAQSALPMKVTPLTPEAKGSPYEYIVGRVTKRVKDSKGIWFEGILNQRSEWFDYVSDLIERGVLQYSTDSIAHLVERVPQPNNTNWVKSWPIPMISLTHRPAEIRTFVNFVGGGRKNVLLETNSETQPVGYKALW